MIYCDHKFDFEYKFDVKKEMVGTPIIFYID